MMMNRTHQGIGANKVHFDFIRDVRLVEDGRVYFHDIGRNILLHLLYAHTVLCHVGRDYSLRNFNRS